MCPGTYFVQVLCLSVRPVYHGPLAHGRVIGRLSTRTSIVAEDATSLGV